CPNVLAKPMRKTKQTRNSRMGGQKYCFMRSVGDICSETMPPLVKHLKEEWEACGFAPDDLVILACSGGKDSMVLLDVLLQAGIQPHIVHAHYGLRGKASDEDEAFVKKTAKKAGLSFSSYHCPPEAYAKVHHQSIQMAARELRYAWLQELMK